jgi:regulator of protease activity HflC (stomatin/prohibitin superfamily)
MIYALSVVVFGALIVLVFAASYRKPFIIQAWQTGVFYRDGAFVGLLEPGRHVLWGDPKRRQVTTLARNLQLQPVMAIDVLSADRFSFRLSATVSYIIADPHTAYENQYLQRLQLALANTLTALAGERNLDALLSDRSDLPAGLLERAAPLVPELELVQALIGAVQLPPETRRLFTEVERARLEAQASLERSRGEQASLRSLANAARLLKGNPELMNLRLLQSVGSKGNTIVLGQNALSALTPSE